MPRIVQVRGTTGSGKTTAMRKAIDLAGGGVTRTSCSEVTVTPEFTAIGDYNANANCVGADRFSGKTELMRTIRSVMLSGEGRIAFESMIFSTTYKSAQDVHALARRFGYDYSCVFLNIDFDTALARILTRNGGKPINHDKLAERILRNAVSREKIRASGIRCVDVDAASLSADEVGAIVYREIMR